jgi:Flp pilus assembly protein TadG
MLAHWARADARASLGEGDMFEQLKSKISARAVRLLRSPLPRRFVSQRKASTTVEFGLLAAPFVALIFAILQTAILFFADQSLETAAATAARLILTGQAQTQGWDAAQFKSQVCSVITGLFSCNSGVYIDVENYSSFAAVSLGMPVSGGVFQTSSLGYNPGGPGDVVVVRLYYKYPVYVDLFGFSLSTLTGGYNLLAATAVFKNEPYASS